MRKFLALCAILMAFSATAKMENVSFENYPICSDIVEMEFNTVYKLYCESDKAYTLESMCDKLYPYAAGGFGEADLAYDRYCR